MFTVLLALWLVMVVNHNKSRIFND